MTDNVHSSENATSGVDDHSATSKDCGCKDKDSDNRPCAEDSKKRTGLFTNAKWCNKVHTVGTPLGIAAGQAVWSIRWTMVPMYLLLLVTMTGYSLFFLKNLLQFFFSEGALGFLNHSAEEWLLFILNQLDITMIGMLTVIICKGGYAIFVQEFGGVPKKLRPRWMSHLDVTMLKVKMSMSLASVSGVHLLKTFVNIAETGKASWGAIGAELAIHGMFLISILVFQMNDIFMAFAKRGQPHDENNHH